MSRGRTSRVLASRALPRGAGPIAIGIAIGNDRRMPFGSRATPRPLRPAAGGRAGAAGAAR